MSGSSPTVASAKAARAEGLGASARARVKAIGAAPTAEAQAGPPGAPTLAVAVSAGLDSTALLHAATRAAKTLGLQVVALHVHHGLMPQADTWWRQVRLQCARWRRAGAPLQFRGIRLDGAPAPAQSVEAWARRERYRALAKAAREEGASLVLLAHHRRDQAETVLLQGLRGGGTAGLAAMPRAICRGGIVWARPWLDSPREAIEAYAHRHRLRVVEDPSNADLRFARSRLRQLAWPALSDAFPWAEASLAAVAVRMQEADACVRDLAALDADAGALAEGALVMTALMTLPTHRRANLLRHWATLWSPIGLPRSLLQRLMAELPSARTGQRWPAPGGQLRLARGGRLQHLAGG